MGGPCWRLHLGCVCPGEPAPLRQLCLRHLGTCGGNRRRGRRSAGPLEWSQQKENLWPCWLALVKRRGEDYVKMRREESTPVCFICIQRCQQKKVRKSEKHEWVCPLLPIPVFKNGLYFLIRFICLLWFLGLVAACGLSRGAERRLWAHGLRELRHRALLLHAVWDLPRSAVELASPALAGRLLSTVPLGKYNAVPFKRSFRLEIRVQRFLSILAHQCGVFGTNDETMLIHCYHSKSIVYPSVHSWCAFYWVWTNVWMTRVHHYNILQSVSTSLKIPLCSDYSFRSLPNSW